MSDEQALTIPQAAERMGISVRHFKALNASGRVPRPIRFGRATRWLSSELTEWMRAGAPERSKWEASR